MNDPFIVNPLRKNFLTREYDALYSSVEFLYYKFGLFISKTTKILAKRNCKEMINTSKNSQCDSKSGLHLLQNKQYANNYNDEQFSILARARSPFQLSTLEATYIKNPQTILFRQKELPLVSVYSVQR